MPVIIDSGNANDPTAKTALDLITGALRKIGQYAPGEALSAEDAKDGLDTLNAMLDMWSTQKLSVFNQIETVKNLTAGQATYTVGSGQYFDIERPLSLVRAYSRLTTASSSVDFPCDIWTLEKYTAIGLKSQPGPWPKGVYYNTGFPTGTLYVWPVPTSNIEFHLWSDQVFSTLDLDSTVSLPRGYFLGLQFSLAELLCSEYGIQVPALVAKKAGEFVKALKDLNAEPQAEATMDGALVVRGANDAGWILTGGFA